jgi:hypothetical protein
MTKGTQVTNVRRRDAGTWTTPGHPLEKRMRVEVILSVAVGLWMAVVLLVVSLCRAAKDGDAAMDAAWAEVPAAVPGSNFTRVSPSSGGSLRTLSLYDAAGLLGVSPQTLEMWGARYGFPTPSPEESRYSQFEVLALRDSLEDGLSIASAVVHARERTRRRRPASPPGVVHHRDGGLAS